VPAADHHTEYLTKAVAALTPEGRRRVDEILDQLVDAAGNRSQLVRFATDRRIEAELGRANIAPHAETEPALTKPELDALVGGFMTIRDEEHLEDVAGWANAVLALLKDTAPADPGG